MRFTRTIERVVSRGVRCLIYVFDLSDSYNVQITGRLTAGTEVNEKIINQRI